MLQRFALKNGKPCRLCLSPKGRHRFGGEPSHAGVTPNGTDVPMHLVLRLDLKDPNCPFKSDGSVRFLPLYYPLMYGFGGPEVQYRVASDKQIEILYLSDPTPDTEDERYVRVAELPSSPARIIPLTYEQSRIVAFAGGYYQPSKEDWEILHELRGHHPLVLVGGYQRLPLNAGEVICRNPECEFHERPVWVDVIASIPPIPVEGTDEFWYEYQGGDVEFYFCFCSYCTTVIAFNVAS